MGSIQSWRSRVEGVKRPRQRKWCVWVRENIVWSQILYATMLLIQKFQIVSGKKCWNKFVDVHKMCPHNSCKFQNQIRNVLRETKKTNAYVNSIILTFYLFVTLVMFDFSFLFLLVYFEFGSENSRDCKDISCDSCSTMRTCTHRGYRPESSRSNRCAAL
jgi:hypothetical protein